MVRVPKMRHARFLEPVVAAACPTAVPHPHYHYSPVDRATLEVMIAGSWWRRLSADRQVSPRFASRWRL